MGSKRDKRRVWPAAGLLAISVLLHLALLLLPVPGPRQDASRPESTGIRVDLVARPPLPQPPEAAPPQPSEPESEAPPEADQSTPAEGAPLEKSPTSRAGPEYATRQHPPLPTSEPDSQAIRAQLLGAARELGQEKEQPKKGRGLTYRDVPELPSQPGWLHQYTGRVATSIDRWRGNDGSRSARIVTGSGQVICVRTRAPTTGEIFNPWMSSAVPMMEFCGRERPSAPNGTDPWLRLPGEDGE